jgi:hypothetical protein
MYITNLTGIKFSDEKLYKCGKTRADYLINQAEQTLLSIDAKGNYVFAYTKELDEALSNLPFCIKVFHR